MKALRIKKSRKSLPLEIINTLVFLFPAIYFPYAYDLHIIVLILLLVYMLLVIGIAVYVIAFIRSNTCITISDNGIQLENKYFFEWAAIESYAIKEEKIEYNSAETGRGYAISQILCLTLKNEELVRFPVDQLDKKPAQIIELFDQRKAATSGGQCF
jgi:flagellar basal body-associated protein FliL